MSSGAMARVIPIKGSPFGHSDLVTRAVVDKLNRMVRENYGHAVLSRVRWILDHISDLPSWKTRYDALRYRFDNTFGAASRVADACALISLTGELAHDALALPWRYTAPMDQLWEGIADEFSEIDVCVHEL